MAAKNDSKPFLESWLGRTRRQLARSGTLSELAMILSSEDGLGQAVWRGTLQRILDGSEEPGFDLVTRIDSILSHPAAPQLSNEEQSELFG